MRKYREGIVVFAALTAVFVAPVALARDVSLEQYISPLQCVSDTVNNGITVQEILSPSECNELLYPTPAQPPPTTVYVEPVPSPWSSYSFTPLQQNHSSLQNFYNAEQSRSFTPDSLQFRDNPDNSRPAPWPIVVVISGIMSFTAIYLYEAFRRR